MIERAHFVVAVAAAVLCSAALASGATKPIAKLALQRADLPAGTERAPFGQPDIRVNDRSTLAPLGVKGLQGASYTYLVPAGGTVTVPGLGAMDKQWSLEGDVFRAPDESGAKRLFALGKAARIGFFSDFPQSPQSVALPRFGDEQIGAVGTNADGVHVFVLVRTGAIVWQLAVLPVPRQFKAAKAQVTAVVKTYAAKQKLRVGKG